MSHTLVRHFLGAALRGQNSTTLLPHSSSRLPGPQRWLHRFRLTLQHRFLVICDAFFFFSDRCIQEIKNILWVDFLGCAWAQMFTGPTSVALR